VKATNRYDHLLRGFAADLTGAQRAALTADPRVSAIVRDGVVRATGDPNSEVPPGVKRVGSLQNAQRTGGSLDVDIAIVDTGIDTSHSDLNVVGGYNCTGGGTGNYDDGNSFGHGTHVAGIAAAKDNGSGVEGVAAGARLWAIKVLTDSGLGYWSWVICGLDHVAAMDDPNDSSKPRIEVVNMSLAGGGFDDGNCGDSNYDPLHDAVCRLERRGVTMVVAAGNEHANAMNYIPAAYDEVITVSAIADYDGQGGGNSTPPSGCSAAGGQNAGAQSDDAFAKFSDHGKDVDLIAPGVCVRSTLPNGYGRMTGTSMAAPHVAGGAALYYLHEKAAGHGRPTTREVRAALIEAGSSNWRTGTDRDSTHEPLLDVSSFNTGADFFLGATPQVHVADPGDSPSFDIWLARLGGFGGAVNISVLGSTLPPGANANVNPNAPNLPNGAAARVTINLGGGTPAGTYDITVRGMNGGTTRSTTVRVIVEAAANGGPWIEVRSGPQGGGFALPVRIEWPASGGNYQLQRSRDGGAWSTIANTNGTSVNSTSWPGSRYQFRVRSGAGAWKYGASQVVVPVYPPDLSLSGNWTRTSSFSSYGELMVNSSQAGARATLNFQGRGVAWMASTGPSRGKANVFIDGSFVSQVDLYSGSNRARRIVFTHSFGGFGSHTLRIDVLGQPNGHPSVNIDTILVVAH
jgi:subtilisin family serine protease